MNRQPRLPSADVFGQANGVSPPEPTRGKETIVHRARNRCVDRQTATGSASANWDFDPATRSFFVRIEQARQWRSVGRIANVPVHRGRLADGAAAVALPGAKNQVAATPADLGGLSPARLRTTPRFASSDFDQTDDL